MFQTQFVTYAQNNEDVLLWRALKGVQHGFYIDVGAQDPVKDSVTKAFYERGWHGINVEPIPHWHERLVEDRPHDINLRLAVSNEPGTLKLFEVDDSGLSTSDLEFAHRHEAEGYTLREQVVECTTLDQIVADNHVDVVHFLKIDCEGAEKSVLEGASLSDVRPWIILVEATEPNSTQPTWQQWEHLITARGYRFVFFDGLNRFYLAEEHMDLSPSFDAPVNVFDSVRHASELDTQRQMDRLRDEVEGLRGAAANASLRTELAAVAAERDTVKAERDAIKAERDAVRLERDAIRLERDAATARRDAIAIECNDLTDRILESQRRIDATAAECMGLKQRQLELQHESEMYRQELTRLKENQAALLSSHSWRITAPLRGCSRAGRSAYRRTRGTIYLVLRPFAHAMRPMLRRLSRNSIIRKIAIGALGKHSRLAEHSRLFLFGTAYADQVRDIIPLIASNEAEEHEQSSRLLQPEAGHPADSSDSFADLNRPFDVDEIMERVRALVAQRHAARG